MPIHLLVVDDEPDFEFLLCQRFKKRIQDGDYDIIFARNGKQALKILESHSEIDIILTDINMPEMDGFTFLDKVNEKYKSIKAVVITAYGDMENIRMAMNRGAFDFITKPIDFEDLEITIGKTFLEVKEIKEGIQAKDDVIRAISDKVKAEKSEQIKQQFLANMSHEIRTPMNSIVGMTDLLRRLDPRPDQSKYLNAIAASADNLLVIINDILDLSKIEAGKLQIKKTTVNIREILDEIAGLFKVKTEEKKLKLKVRVGNDVPEMINSDPVRLKQILGNLISNAVKFTDNGSVEVLAEVSIPAEKEKKLILTVKDSGIGISPTHINNIFESFSQIESLKTDKNRGTGLGLAICKQLVELLDGRISVESSLDNGSSFSIEFVIREHQLENINLSRDADQLCEAMSNLKVLLVEDNAFNVIVAKDFLENELDDIHVDVANNGMEAIEKFMSSDYSVVLMDLQMPVMDGYEAVRKIRHLEGGKRPTPIIAMTASAEAEERNKCLDSGMDDYIPKPFDIDVLLRKIAGVVN
ncbi:MAG: response regulator [Chitinophagales bacterium]|nr:response regulator [Chitinophagales bacterium]